MDKVKSAAALLGRKGGSVKSERKAASSAENGKKGGRPKNSDFEIDVIKNGKPRKLRLVNNGTKQYEVCVVYPPDESGQVVCAPVIKQPKVGDGFPDIRWWAIKNGFEVV